MWRNFDKRDNYFYHLLSQCYQLDITSDPDFLIYGPRGIEHRKYKCIKIFYTGENVRPDFWQCDFAFSFDYPETPRNYRLPLYALYDDPLKLLKKNPINDILRAKTRFCNFVYSNPNAKKRIRFFKLLNKYKKVDSGGSVLNNLGYKIQNKREFISSYKFTISFENESYPGYSTEKIFEPMLESSIPIYWGNPLVTRDFNSKSFINVHEFDSYEDVIEQIIKIDQDHDLYIQYLSEPFFINNQIPESIIKDNILKRFDYIFNQLDVMLPISRTIKPQLSYFRKDTLMRFQNYTRQFAKKLPG